MHVIKKKTHKIVSICIFLVFASFVTFVGYNQNSSLRIYPLTEPDEKIKQADYPISYYLTGGPGIYIDDSVPSNDWSTNELSSDWITGSGTLGDPYEIKNVYFNGQDRNIHLITIKNSNAHFRIEYCTLLNANDAQYNAIYLDNVENGIISDIETSECKNGIRLVNSNYNRIQGIFARNNEYSGIEVSGGTTNRIKNNSISNGVGIRLSGGSLNNDVLENIITTGEYNEYGIILSSSHYNNITFNIISDRYRSSGISLISSNYNNVSGNTVSNSGIGLDISNSDNNLISANSILNSTDPWNSNFGFGIEITSSSQNTISMNNISGNQFHGIYMKNTNNNSIRENTLMNNGFDDIHLINTLGINLILNKMTGSGLYFDIPYSGLASINIETSNLVNSKPIYLYINQSGLGQADFINAGQIFLFDCNDTVISGLEFDSVTTGITMEQCINSTISSNGALNNSRWAFSLIRCNFSRILNNDIMGSGIILESSNHNNLIGNSVSYSKQDGISLENCQNIYISGNTANYNNEIGIRLYETNHGLIHNNIANYNNETGISVKGRESAFDWNGTEYVYTYYYLLNNTLTSNEANDNDETGIYITEVENIILTGNTAKRNSDGIILESFGSGLISENEVSANKYGLTLSFGSDIIVNNNTINSNVRWWNYGYSDLKSGGGILIDNCQRVEITDNVANENKEGLVISDCSVGRISHNQISGNGEVWFNILFPVTPPGDAGIKISGSSFINITANILDDNGVSLSESHYNSLILNEITGFGYILENSDNNLISRNIITGALIAIDLDSSSYNKITLNIIVAQQCFREKGNCTTNIFEDNDCTEVLPAFYLREIVSIIGIASVLGINVPLLLKRRKGRK